MEDVSSVGLRGGWRVWIPEQLYSNKLNVKSTKHELGFY